MYNRYYEAILYTIFNRKIAIYYFCYCSIIHFNSRSIAAYLLLLLCHWL